jgi:hypothetical protein
MVSNELLGDARKLKSIKSATTVIGYSYACWLAQREEASAWIDA